MESERAADRSLRMLSGLLEGADEQSRAAVEEVLFDPVTQLPTLHLLLRQIHSTLQSRNQVGLLTIHVSPYVKVEELFGWEMFDEVLRTVADLLEDIKKETLREADILAELSMSGNSFVFVLSPPRYNRFVRYEELDRLRRRIAVSLEEKITSSFPPELAVNFGAFIGCVVLNHEPDVPVSRLIIRGLDAAYTDAFQEREEELRQRKAALSRIIHERLVYTVFQPIVDLEEERVLGYEAFSRGPKGEFQNPDYLFRMAYQTNLLWQLERICRDQAISRIADVPEGKLLFLNVDPDSILDPQLSRWSTQEHIGPRIVLEITERVGIADYVLFRRVLNLIHSMGLRFAIDDLGSAYSGLRMVAEVRPHYIKLDMDIARNVNEDHVKRELIRTIARFSRAIETPLIVEGVETQAELDTLREIGIRYAQGFLFGSPDAKFGGVDFAATRRG